MYKKANEIQKHLEVSMALIKSADEVKGERAERKKQMEERAVKAAEERRKKKAEREAFQEWRRNNPSTDEEKAERREKFKELLNTMKGDDTND